MSQKNRGKKAMFTVEQCTIVDLGDLPQFNALLQVLSPTNPARCTTDNYKNFFMFMFQGTEKFIVAREEKTRKLIGMAILSFKFIPPEGVVGYVDNVAVLDEWQHRGVATRLDEKIKSVARAKNAHCIDLTSNPKRIPANNFYKKQGYVQRDTNVYRFILPKEF